MKYTVVMKENKDFVSLFKKGKFVNGKNCVVYYRRNGTNFNRLGITTGKKAGNAVMRSRCRRIIRQAYRETESFFPRGYDFVIVARENTCHCKSTEIRGFLQNKAAPRIKEQKNNREMQKKKFPFNSPKNTNNSK